ncbi:MAG: hypothetical protein ACE5JP_18085 [Candidatus Bipolaricaulia bacterium]
MKIDTYTKVVLTVIALALVGLLLKPALPPRSVQAQEDVTQQIQLEEILSNIEENIGVMLEQLNSLVELEQVMGREEELSMLRRILRECRG